MDKYDLIYREVAATLFVYMGGKNTHSAFAVEEWIVHDSFAEGDDVGDYYVVGAGCFSVCLAGGNIPEGMVCKVSLSAYDQGPQYWRWAKDNPDVEYVCPINAMGHDRETGWRWCVMPLMTPVGYEFESSDLDDMRYDSDVCEWASTIGELDLHRGNVMYYEGEVIIIDPVSMTPAARRRCWGS